VDHLLLAAGFLGPGRALVALDLLERQPDAAVGVAQEDQFGSTAVGSQPSRPPKKRAMSCALEQSRFTVRPVMEGVFILVYSVSLVVALRLCRGCSSS
jgi:hypothetical protein